MMEKVCRICRTTETIDELNDFYEDPKLAVDFYFITGIMVINIDPSCPALICSTCSDNIKIFTKFKRRAQKSDNHFRQQTQAFEEEYWNNLNLKNAKVSKSSNKELPKIQEANVYEESEMPGVSIYEKPEMAEVNVKNEPEIEDNILYYTDDIPNQLDLINETELPSELNYSNSEEMDISTPIKMEPATSNAIKMESISPNQMQLSFNSKAVACKICSKILSSKPSLRIHMSVIHNTDDKVYTCRHCQKIFRHVSYIKKHVETNHSMSYLKSRDLVIKVVKDRDKVPVTIKNKSPKCENKQEQLISSDVTSNKCNICEREFATIRSCKEHMIITHGADKKVFMCKLCEKTFKLKEYLARHMKSQHRLRPNKDNYSIKSNDEEEVEYEEIDKDLVDMVRQTATNNNYCSMCEHQFNSTRSYLEHMKIKHKSDDKFYICKFCDEQFIVPSYLKRHTKTAHGHKLKTQEIIIKREVELGDKAKREFGGHRWEKRLLSED